MSDEQAASVETSRPKPPIHGHRTLRGSQNLRVQREIKIMFDAGKTIPEIVSTLKLAKGVAVTNLYGNFQKRLITQIIEESTIDALLIMAEGLETIKYEVQNMKVKAVAGKLDLTPEQMGTFLRGIEKSAELVKLLSGRGPQMYKDTAREKKDPRLIAAQAHLDRLNSAAVNGKPFEGETLDADSHTDDD